MEKKIREVIRSPILTIDLVEIYQYGVDTFGKVASDIFLEEIDHLILGLSYKFNTYHECKHLRTKSKMYRNIVLGKYLIVYRVTPNKIEVLRAFHGSRAIKVIQSARSIKF